MGEKCSDRTELRNDRDVRDLTKNNIDSRNVQL